MITQGLLFAESNVRAYLTPEPLFPLTGWWWLLVGLLSIGLLAFVVFMYLYDSVELSAGLAATLMALRIMAFVGMLIFLLNPGIRTEKQIVKNSRVSILVDTSISMGLRDGENSEAAAGPSRVERVAHELAEGTLLPQLREKHDVVVYSFDQQSKPTEIASFQKLNATPTTADGGVALLTAQNESLRASRMTAIAAGVILLFSLVIGAVSIYIRSNPTGESVAAWTSFLGILLLIAAVVTLGIADLRSTDVSLLQVVGLSSGDAEVDEEQPTAAEDEKAAPEVNPADLRNALLPRGTETRLGDALRYVVDKERGGPVAGIIVFSDGRSNMGTSYKTAAYAARDAHIPVYTVGMGTKTQPANVRVVDLQAPNRVYPGDKFTIKGLVQSYGFAGRGASLRLVSTKENDPNQVERFEQESNETLLDDGRELSVSFDITPDKDDGRRVYSLRIIKPEKDMDARDNTKSATVEVVDRKSKVLLIAGGPSREFQFLRNQLYRDDETSPTIWLQSAEPGMAFAEGREEVMFEFPETEDILFEFDCIVAFDADWRLLKEEQVERLERWVAEKAGGLIVVAGPVFTPQWTRYGSEDARMKTMRGLYPVSFFSQGSATVKVGRFGGEEAWPLKFTREGQSEEFLWLDDSAQKAKEAWDEFRGVYGYYAVNESKPGATVYAHFSDPSTAGGPNDDLPIYLAGHFYGAGRVFFQASGEMWRIREVDETHFETYYTKLIRWASQGRLLRDSTRGVLLVDKDRCLLGDHVEVRAILTNASHQPLLDEEVTAVLIQPDGTRENLALRKLKDGTREGTFAGQFTALQEGDYHIALPVPESEEAELLTREVRVRIPDLEIEKPQRHDELLKEIADETRGQYFLGVDGAVNRDGQSKSVMNVIQPQDQRTFLPGTPDLNFSTKLKGWLLALICGVLSIEWLMRRLSKLA